MTGLKRSVLVIFVVLAIDQIFKIWVKTTMHLGQDIEIFDWFKLRFIENNGMAFGIEFWGDKGKLTLSIFRIVASLAIGWYIFDLIKKKAPVGLIISMSLILAGAIGNILDSAFYGMFFSESFYHEVAEIFPEKGGYQSFLMGKVVDMLYFPLIDTRLPDWSPIWANERFVFFRPVFNIADSAVTVGVASILIFHRKYFNQMKEAEETQTVENEISKGGDAKE